MSITTLDRLDDHALTVELGRLAGCERESTAAFVANLAEFDARRLYEGEGRGGSRCDTGVPRAPGACSGTGSIAGDNSTAILTGG
jgi:hypothetical protein